MLEGYVVGDGESIVGAALCDDCASDLVACWTQAEGYSLARVQRIEVPLVAIPEPVDGDVTLSLRYRRGDPGQLTEVQIAPEPESPDAELDVLAEGYARLAEYTNGYLMAQADDVTTGEG